MSKAVLVIDMPESCYKCKLQEWLNCKIVKGCHIGETRPDWCPMRPLPEKIPEPKDGYEAIEVSIKRDGWNACIDAITGD